MYGRLFPFTSTPLGNTLSHTKLRLSVLASGIVGPEVASGIVGPEVASGIVGPEVASGIVGPEGYHPNRRCPILVLSSWLPGAGEQPSPW